MNDKLKRLAKNVSELVHTDKDTLQETYDNLRGIMSRQKDYFGNFPAESILKLTFYIWSYKKTGDFLVADKILNDVSFAVLFTTEGVNYEEECSECDGNGNISCSHCDGDGSVRCDTCDGDGNEECPECNGTGSIDDDGTPSDCFECDGKGTIDCSDCGGSGENSCYECGGDGSQECYECDGSGMVDSGELVYNVHQIVTWSRYIKDRCELTEQSAIITMSEYDFDRLRNDYIVLSGNDEHGFLEDFVESNEMYCPYYSDAPKLFLQVANMTIFFDYSMQPYLNK